MSSIALSQKPVPAWWPWPSDLLQYSGNRKTPVFADLTTLLSLSLRVCLVKYSVPFKERGPHVSKTSRRSRAQFQVPSNSTMVLSRSSPFSTKRNIIMPVSPIYSRSA